jgi:cytochrome c oxidase subunit 2
MALFSACATGNPQDTFTTGGPVAEDQAGLFQFIFWIAVVVFALVEGALIFITLRYRRRRGDQMPKQTHGNTKLEITWTIIPSLIILVIAIPTVQGIWRLAEPPEGEEVLNIEAIGHQWWFEFRYPGEEIITANELRVPVGMNVHVSLKSQDVIHSFWAPQLFGKVDMVPVNENPVWFRADEPGVYFGQCAEFCGLEHALMRFRVIAMPPEDYTAWVAGMQTPPDPLAAGSPQAAGQALFGANCSTCHTTNGYQPGSYQQEIAAQDSRWAAWVADPENARIVSAPNLTHLGTRITLGAGIRELNRDSLIAWITNPGEYKVGTRMQEHAQVYQTANGHASLSAQDIENIADYLLSLVPGEMPDEPGGPPGDPVALGGQLFASNGCSGCHSTGSDTRVGPGLAGIGERAGARVSGLNADQYITQSLREPQAYLAEGIATVQMPTFSNLSQQEVDALIAYLKTLN